MKTDGGTLVGSGTFRVDRKQALEKLKDFQLPDPTKFLLSWVRCAVASGATGIQFKTAAPFLQMQFNGTPFSRGDLDGVYDGLFESTTADSVRNRFLATGLLSALRLDPVEVRIISGKRPERHRLRVACLGQETIEQTDYPGAATVLQIEWRGSQRHVSWAARNHLEEHYGMGPILIEIEGAPAIGTVDWFDRLPPRRDAIRQAHEGLRLWFNEEGVRGFIRVPDGLLYKESTLRLHTYGVLAESAGLQLPMACVDGSINDDEFTLNASQAGVVRNERFERTMKVVAAQAERLLLQIIGSRSANLATAGECFEDSLWRRCWQDALGGGCETHGYTVRTVGDSTYTDYVEWKGERKESLGTWMASILRQFDQQTVDGFNRMAYAIPWLRDVCERNRHGLGADSTPPALRKLWDFPLFWGVTGRPLSLAGLEALRARLGHIPYSYFAIGKEEKPLPYEVVWCDSEGARNLLFKRFPNCAKDVSIQLNQLAKNVLLSRAAPTAKSHVAYLEAAGVLDLLIRAEFQAGAFQGEVGLPVSPLEGGGSLHVIRNGASAGYIPLECGLRFVAAVNDPGSGKGASGPVLLQEPELRMVKDAAMEAARGLYRKLAPEYGGQVRTPRNDAICTHLLDYLVMAIGEGTPLATLPEQDHWAASVLFFHTLSGWWSYARLREAFQEGRAIGIIPVPPVTEALLARLLPGAGFLAVPGKPGVRLVFKKRPKPAPDQCVLGKDDHALLDCLIALVGEKGTLYDAPDDPLRSFLLQAVGRLLAPWSGHEKTPEHVTIRDMLEHLPMFRRPDGTGWTVSDLDERLAAGAVVPYVPADRPQPDARARLVLAGPELDLIAHLWPSRKDLLVLFNPSSSSHRSVHAKKALSPPPAAVKPIARQTVPKAPAFSPVSQPPAPPPRPVSKAAGSVSKKPEAIDLCRETLLGLRGRRGVKLMSGTATLRLRTFSGGLLDFGKTGVWTLNASHAMAEAVLGSALADEQKALYLASLVYTAANRELSNVTDLDDVKFQQALADQLTEKPE